MMTNLFITIGCSGAGKSTWINNHATPGWSTIISPDDERRKLSNVNDQTVSGRAFESCYEQLFHLSPRDCAEVYFDATSLKTEYISSIVGATNPQLKKELKVTLVLFEDSRNADLCISRIHEDIKNKVDRSNTPDDVVRTMSKRYIELVDSENFDDFCKEHEFEKVIVKSFEEHI